MKKVLLVLLSLFITLFVAGCSGDENSSEVKKPKKIVLDYAYYSPTSLVLKKFGWAEEEFKKEGIEVEFVLSQGSNKALEFLNSSSVDFGSTAGAAALIAKSKGAPIETVYLFSKPEWTALLTNKDSSIKSVKDLKGKKVAATLGTDPYIFLLRALDEEGLSEKDIELVNLQHSDGAAALSTKQVDAWAGLDPHMARVELETGANLFYRNEDFNTYGTLNVRSEFAKQYPEYVEKVINLYEKSRLWVLDNPEEAAEILASEAQIDLKVANKQLVERTDFSNSIPGEEQKKALASAGKVLQTGGVIDKSVDLKKTIDELINPKYAESIVKSK
ncbi:MAG: aliphatic sulfonate transporter substrate-binding protein [Bacillales bacterium]|jgi:sulfonate transport system substrate-binding protein|nr:aliphatic sulfonate transporter substrate-binding protein [Bacillales bacterium]